MGKCFKDCVCNRHRGNRTTHGLRRSPEYQAFAHAKTRCYNKNYYLYHRYGGRGIKVLFRSFVEFYNHIGPRPSPTHSLERKNNNGHYEAGNVVWATKSEQARNTAGNLMVTYQGSTCTLAEFCETLNLPYKTVYHRIKYAGWSVDTAFTKPVRR